MKHRAIEFLNKQINAARTEENRGENSFAPWASDSRKVDRQSSQLDFRRLKEIFREDGRSAEERKVFPRREVVKFTFGGLPTKKSSSEAVFLLFESFLFGYNFEITWKDALRCF